MIKVDLFKNFHGDNVFAIVKADCGGRGNGGLTVDIDGFGYGFATSTGKVDRDVEEALMRASSFVKGAYCAYSTADMNLVRSAIKQLKTTCLLAGATEIFS